MGMGEGVRRIRMEEKEKQTSILLPWCHLGTGTMRRNEQQSGQRKGRYLLTAEHRSEEDASRHRMTRILCVPASRRHASLQSWHTRSNQSSRRRTVLVKSPPEDSLLIAICLLGQSQEEVPRQRLPAIL
ncbi:hypothetical protein FQN60_014117 [Etheostoma spectabile]|uniref:Uncharacterized protein n=1 Tax=Etheostoma spectabile TaxID=54343 RepID=A0A5J5DAR7_9PERO|nr:hypothetical protein FQN60_014117 [Etheostoma spectabile]